MVQHTVDNNGNCSTCQKETKEGELLLCYDCKSYYHGICDSQPIFCNKTFLASFLKIKSGNFIFVCNTCITKRENKEASSIKDEINELKDTVKTLIEEFKLFKESKTIAPENKEQSPWLNKSKVTKMKSSLCIKANGIPLNVEKVKELATENGIQVSKAEVKENGDIYVDLPSKENREKLTPLLREENLNDANVVELKSKLPTIAILSVNKYTTKEDFVERVKKQNPSIKERIENGSEFSIVFSKKPKDTEADIPGKNIIK